MKDLEKMGIVDIERHIYNFRLLTMFLRQIGLYYEFKKIIFLKRKRMPNDLFKTMNETILECILLRHKTTDNICDKKWSALFTYRTFIGCYWCEEHLKASTMRKISIMWAKYLFENNFDKFKSNGNITFKLNGRPLETSEVFECGR